MLLVLYRRHVILQSGGHDRYNRMFWVDLSGRLLSHQSYPDSVSTCELDASKYAGTKSFSESA